MEIDVKYADNLTTILLNGRLDTTTAPSFEEVVKAEIAKGGDLILDFSDLAYISSAGLRVLLTAQKSLQAGATMKLTGVCEDVMEVLVVTGFTTILTIA